MPPTESIALRLGRQQDAVASDATASEEKNQEELVSNRLMSNHRRKGDARRGLFYRPVKKQITLRLDADVVEWFKSRARDGRGYQTDINRALRQHVHRREKQPY